MCFETSNSNNNSIAGDDVWVSFQRRDIIQISKTSFYNNRFSSSDPNLRAMLRFRIQLLLPDGQWSSKYIIDKISIYGVYSTDWILLIINFTEAKYGIELVLDKVDTTYRDICLSNVLTTLSVC